VREDGVAQGAAVGVAGADARAQRFVARGERLS